MKKRRIVIKVEAGFPEVAEAPDGTQIHIIDYDTEDTPKAELCRCHLTGANAEHIHRRMGQGEKP